jgi:hypothetical protein
LSLDLPASKEEADKVHEAMNRLQNSLEQSSLIAQEVTELLTENFLAIDEEYKKSLRSDAMKIDVAIWRMNVILHEMRNYQSRIISPKNTSQES